MARILLIYRQNNLNMVENAIDFVNQYKTLKEELETFDKEDLINFLIVNELLGENERD